MSGRPALHYRPRHGRLEAAAVRQRSVASHSHQLSTAPGTAQCSRPGPTRIVSSEEAGVRAGEAGGGHGEAGA